MCGCMIGGRLSLLGNGDCPFIERGLPFMKTLSGLGEGCSPDSPLNFGALVSLSSSSW